MTPLPLRSLTSQASSEADVGHATRNLEPFALISKSTPLAASVKLKPLPDTSIKTGETQFGSSGLHSQESVVPPSKFNEGMHGVGASDGDGTGDGDGAAPHLLQEKLSNFTMSLQVSCQETP
jgi:hypothetical protein